MKKVSKILVTIVCLTSLMGAMPHANFQDIYISNDQSRISDIKYFSVCGLCGWISTESNEFQNAQKMGSDHKETHSDDRSCYTTVTIDRDADNFYQAVCSSCTWTSKLTSNSYGAECMGYDHKNCLGHTGYTVNKNTDSNQKSENLSNDYNSDHRSSNSTIDAIEVLQNQPPTKALLTQAFDNFEFDSDYEASSEEAKRMLEFLNAVEIQRDYGCIDCYVGKLYSNYYVIIWQKTYGKENTYGIRFGVKEYGSFPFVKNNNTYLEIEK